jgi:Fe-S cluster biogenesis protein NfuA
MPNSDIEKKISDALDEIRPHLQMDGGDVEFVSFDEKSGELKVKLRGACQSCPMSAVTLQEGVGRVVKEKVPEVKQVVNSIE